jgi:hypothetical protein
MLKYFSVLLSIFIIFSNLSKAQSTTSTQNQISIAIDYAKSGLSEKGKEILLPLMYDGIDDSLNAKIRYSLGVICFDEQDYNCVRYHWQRIILDYPNSPEAEIIKEIVSISKFLWDSASIATAFDFQFEHEYRTSRLFWSIDSPDYKMNEKELRNPQLALEYIQFLINKYPDDNRKKAILLYDKFLIYAGYNNEGFGFKNVNPQPDLSDKKEKKEFYEKCMAISDSLALIDKSGDYYIDSQFLLGLMASSKRFLSAEIKVNTESAKFFENVMNATKGQNTNLYRIFASLWLKKYYDQQK